MSGSVTGRRRAALGVSLLASIALALAPCTSQAATLKPPHASTGSALHVGDSTAALNGVVNPRGTETSCYFQYGPTTAYGAQTPTVAVGAGMVGVKESQALSGLQLGTTYHYRIVAVSPAAGTILGQDRTFTTKQIPLKFVITKTSSIDVFGSPFSLTGTLSGTGGASHEVMLQASPFPYLGGFTDLGGPGITDDVGDFSFRLLNLTQTTKLRVRTLDAPPSYSQAVTVHVAVLVTIHAHTARRRGLVRLEGTVAPSAVGAPVRLQWVKPGHTPVNVDTTVVRGGTANVSRFSATVRIRHGGLYRALVKVANGRQVSGVSRTILLRATALPVRKAHRTHSRRRA